VTKTFKLHLCFLFLFIVTTGVFIFCVITVFLLHFEISLIHLDLLTRVIVSLIRVTCILLFLLRIVTLDTFTLRSRIILVLAHLLLRLQLLIGYSLFLASPLLFLLILGEHLHLHDVQQ